MLKVRFFLSISQIQGSGIYPTHLKEVARHAEDLGYDGITHGDSLLRDSRVAPRFGDRGDALRPGYLSCLPVLAHFAAVTRRIRLITRVLTVPLYHPAQVAAMGATIDNLSGGRFEMELGTGRDEAPYRAFKLPFEHRGGILVEAIQIIRALWTQDDVTFKGKFFDLQHVKLLSAKPIQKPTPPIWINTEGHKEYLLKRAAQYADGWDKSYGRRENMALQEDAVYLQEFKDNVQFIRDEAKRLGRNPDAIRHGPGSLVLAIGKDDAATRKLANDYLRTIRGEEFGSPPSGDPERVTAYIGKFVEAGATDFNINFVPYSIPENIEMMELFAREVIPNFRK